MKAEIKGLAPEQINPRKYGGMCSRGNAVLHKAEGQKIEEGIDTVATTDAPAIVVDWERWELVREILPMKYCVLPKNDKVPLLDAHSRMSIEDVKGSGRNWKTEEHDLLCKLFVSETEEEVKTKIKEEHIDSVSIGYQTDPNQTVEIPKKATVIIDGVEYKNEFEDNMPLLVRTWWKVKEISLVPIGADEAAKLKREFEQKLANPDLQKKLNESLDQIKQLKMEINTIKLKGGPNMDEPTKKTQEQLRLEAIAEINEASETYGDAAKELAKKTVKELLQGKEVTESTLRDFYKAVTDQMVKNGGSVATPQSFMGMNAKELKDYSIVRAIQNIVKGNRSGVEFEINQDLEKRTGEKAGPKEILMPADIQNVALRNLYPDLFFRAHSMANNSEGGYFVTPTYRADMLKEVLRNDTVLGRLGSTIITGLKGQFQMPKIVSGLTTYNQAENTAGTTSYMVVGLETVDQKRWTGNTKVGRQLLMNIDEGLPGFDQILIKDLYDSANVKMDYDGINGSGAGNNPRGILNQSGPAAASLATIDWKNIVNFRRLIAKAKGRKEDLKWGFSVDVESALKITPKVAGQAIYLINDDGKVDGYMSESSNQIPDAVSILGFWPEFFTLIWGAEKLIVADQPSHTSDEIEISLHRYGNFFLRSSESFAIAEDAAIDIWGE